MEPTTTEILLDLLKRAAAAHGVHEKELGKPDPDWPPWYAEHMTRALREAGYRISRASASPTQREPELLGQTVVVIGGSAGIGLETARRARAEGAKLILTGRDPERLRQAASELDPLSTSAFDALDPASLERFFRDLPTPIDHVMVTAGRPTYGRVVDMDLAQLRSAIDEHLLLAVQVARHAARKVRPGGTLLFMGGTGARHPRIGLGTAPTITAALPALTASLALELAPLRVNLIAAGFVDTPLSASLLGDELEKRRNQLRATLPIRRVVEPADVASLAVHIMINTALTGATYDIDGGQQFVAG
jgi:NAD(P)-dependent dehydrogenase (short-subunit alcohol dehydrogenase family)